MKSTPSRLPKAPPYKTPPDDILAILRSLPWCSQLLSDLSIRSFQSPNRVLKASGEDSLLSKTLSTDQTIQIWQGFHRGPCEEAPLGEFLMVVSLGPGLNGHKDTLHGGVVSLIMDEAMGIAALYTRPPEMTSYTATMTVDYKKPIPTPSFILCRARLEEKSQGRKMWTSMKMEDGEGGLYATGTALFLETKRSAKL